MAAADDNLQRRGFCAGRRICKDFHRNCGRCSYGERTGACRYYHATDEEFQAAVERGGDVYEAVCALLWERALSEGGDEELDARRAAIVAEETAVLAEWARLAAAWEEVRQEALRAQEAAVRKRRIDGGARAGGASWKQAPPPAKRRRTRPRKKSWTLSPHSRLTRHVAHDVLAAAPPVDQVMRALKRFPVHGRRSCAVLFEATEDLALCAVVNGYKDGQGVHAHHDDEPQIMQEAPVLTYSFGAPARFVVRTDDKEEASLLTGEGTLVSMLGPGFQGAHTHAVEGARGGPRVSVGVRVVHRDLLDEGAYIFNRTRLSWEKPSGLLGGLAQLCVADYVRRHPLTDAAPSSEEMAEERGEEDALPG